MEALEPRDGCEVRSTVVPGADTKHPWAEGGARRSGDSRGPDLAAVATVLFRAAAGAGRLPRWAGVPGAGGCALHSPLPGDRFRAGSVAPSEGCKQGGALCPPAPGLPGRAAGGARSGGGAAAALGSGGGGAPAPRRPRAPPPPGRPASSVFVLMEPACSWRVSSHVPWAGGGWGAGGEGAVTHASGGPGARGGCGARGRVPRADPGRAGCPGRIWWGSWELMLVSAVRTWV
ncbi:translation initiation factor IF-2-like [Mustela erminea]|uniref:translation initiation factor IF-2-like n=1 Tax=Mustela erminea TaxID=36723 RepID=UPI00138687F1|nr:translation initiation factor IF-2-like [Mustela erminea]XP_032161280.1 translation initiation factor IF-2-like [Mustela erminea]XP_032161281.1 translation initiation factor IF-2-like [Mustela erminea]